MKTVESEDIMMNLWVLCLATKRYYQNMQCIHRCTTIILIGKVTVRTLNPTPCFLLNMERFNYYDDVEVVNPLGSKRGIHKLGKLRTLCGTACCTL